MYGSDYSIGYGGKGVGRKLSPGASGGGRAGLRKPEISSRNGPPICLSETFADNEKDLPDGEVSDP
jgi:hypothetical protein